MIGDQTTPGSPSNATPAPTTPARLSDSEVNALAALLAAEQAAVYAYGVVGAQMGTDRRAAAQQALTRHATRRDLLAGRLSADKRTIAPAAPAYALPFPVTSERSALDLAAHVEDAIAAAEADLVSASAPAARLDAARWLAESTLAALAWGAPATAFPGLPERGATPPSTRPTGTPTTAQPRTTS